MYFMATPGEFFTTDAWPLNTQAITNIFKELLSDERKVTPRTDLPQTQQEECITDAQNEA